MRTNCHSLRKTKDHSLFASCISAERFLKKLRRPAASKKSAPINPRTAPPGGRVDGFNTRSCSSDRQGATVIATGVSFVSDREGRISSMVVVPGGGGRDGPRV